MYTKLDLTKDACIVIAIVDPDGDDICYLDSKVDADILLSHLNRGS